MISIEAYTSEENLSNKIQINQESAEDLLKLYQRLKDRFKDNQYTLEEALQSKDFVELTLWSTPSTEGVYSSISSAFFHLDTYGDMVRLIR